MAHEIGSILSVPSDAPFLRPEDIAAMRDYLRRLGPQTGSEALKGLREAFPMTPLAARIEAVTQHSAA